MLESITAPISPRERTALIVYMFLCTASIGFLQPFVPLYFASAGLNRWQIGLVTGLGTGLALLVQPLMGRLSDRMSSPRPLMSVAGVVAGIAYMSYRSVQGMGGFILFTALGTNAMFFLSTAGAVLVGRMTVGSNQRGAIYAKYRIWGSVGYILFSLVSGRIVSQGQVGGAILGREQLNTLFTFGPLIFFVIAIVSYFVPDMGKRLQEGIERKTPSRQRAELPLNMKYFLAAYFLYMFGLYGASAYLSLYMRSLHATAYWITGMFSAGVFCEVLVMTQVGRFADKYGRRPALAATFLLMPLRLLLYIPATGPAWVVFVQILHGFNFGIMGTVAIVFINDIASETNRATAQSRLSATAGLATAIGPPLCGWLSQNWGFNGMFALMSVAGAGGAAIFMLWVQESHSATASLKEEGPRFMRPLLRLLSAPPRLIQSGKRDS